MPKAIADNLPQSRIELYYAVRSLAGDFHAVFKDLDANRSYYRIRLFGERDKVFHVFISPWYSRFTRGRVEMRSFENTTSYETANGSPSVMYRYLKSLLQKWSDKNIIKGETK